MATKKPKPITYSTAENFNPLQDYNVGYQVTQQSQMHPEKFGGQDTFNQFHYTDGRKLNRPTTTQDLQGFTANINSGYYGINPATNDMAKSTTFSQPTARYESKESARIAAPHNAGITYDRDIGYVPKAGRVPSTPEQITQRSRETVARMEAANSPADMAAYKAKTFAKESARLRAEGNTSFANRVQGYAVEQTEKARQLGYKGDISKATIKDPTAKPKPSSAPAPQPAPSASKPPQTTSPVKLPVSAAAGAPKPEAVKPAYVAPANGPKSAASVRSDRTEAERKAIGHRPSEIKQSDIDATKRRSESHAQDREIYTKHAQEYDRQGKKSEANAMWGKAEMADKGSKIASKNAELMERDKASRASEIATWDEKKKKYDGSSEEEKKSMADIPKISEPVKKTIIKLDPIMDMINKATPQANAGGAATDPFAYTPPGAGPKMVKAYGNDYSGVMVKARAQVA